MATATATASPPISPGIGDNSKPLITAAELRREYEHVDKALAEIEKAAEAVPPVFEDDDDLNLAKEMAPRMRGASKRVEHYRKEAKAPFDDAVAVVQEVFKAFDARMTALLTKHETAATAYLKKKDAKAKADQLAREAEERAAAAKLADAAKEQAAAGQLTEAVKTQAAAEAATTRADKAQTLADARPAERARTTTEAGTSTLEDRYSFRIIDKTKIDAFKLFPYLTAIELDSVLTRFVKAGGRQLDGVEIFSDAKARL